MEGWREERPKGRGEEGKESQMKEATRFPLAWPKYRKPFMLYVSSRDGGAPQPWGIRHPVAVLGAINLAQTRRQRLPAVLTARSMAMRASVRPIRYSVTA